ncbi:MAG: DUF2203 domain-containing protein [Planctomyces sp.]|jgi:hypothetical protein
MVAEDFLTVDEVNERLPLVRSIVRDVVELHSDIADRRERLASIRQRHPSSSSSSASVYEEEVRQMEEELLRDEKRLEGYSEELLEIGGVLSDAATGTVDFPGESGGDRLWLCWRFDEPVVMYWHSGACGESERLPLCHERIFGDG